MNSYYGYNKDRCKGNLFVISGPSGVGKGTICKELMKQYSDLVFSVSATTRKARPGEAHGREYYFYSTDEFVEMVKADAFLEYAKVYENFYGTPRSFVERIIKEGKDCILEIDVQGALQVKRKKPEGIFIFIVPPSRDELIRRITCRGTEDQAEINKRMNKVDGELAQIKHYDYMVVNDDLHKAVENIRSIITAERSRIKE